MNSVNFSFCYGDQRSLRLICVYQFQAAVWKLATLIGESKKKRLGWKENNRISDGGKGEIFFFKDFFKLIFY